VIVRNYLGWGCCRGRPEGSPNKLGKPPFLQNNKTQTNPQIVKHTPHDHGPMKGGAHCPSNLSGPSSGQPQCPLKRKSALLEGWPPPRAKLHLARGLDAPSGESPPRSRLPQARSPHAHSPDQSIKCSDMTWVLGSKVNPRHADPLTPPGNHTPALFRQPSL
jgi:hypothetical protein